MTDDELAALVELAIYAVNGASSHELTECAERLAVLTHEKRKRAE